MILQYTINDTSDSKSIVSSSDNYNDSKNSDMSYIPSSDDDSSSIPLPKPNKLRGNINQSKKYIQLKIIISPAQIYIQKYKTSHPAKKR